MDGFIPSDSEGISFLAPELEPSQQLGREGVHRQASFDLIPLGQQWNSVR
jgi:hypothetical protein